MNHILYNADCLTILKELENDTIDLIVTDPPYKVIGGGNANAGKGAPSGMLTKNDGKIFDHNNIRISEWASEFFRILKDGCHAYIMCNCLNMQEYINELTRVGFKLHNILIWQKNNVTPNRWYMKNVEYTLFVRKGMAKSINNKGSKTCVSIDNIIGKKLHPTQKPVELMEYYINNSSEEEDIVLDPFMGCGSTGVACRLNNRNFFGIEIDEEYFKIAEERIEGELK